MTTVPLSVLDFVPIAEGGTGAEAVRRSLDLAVRVEDLGYHRYWVGEHHLTEGSAGSAPFVLAAAIAHRTKTLRVGTAAVVMAYNDPIRIVEQVGTLDAVHPGRFDLGIARGDSAPTLGNAPAPVAEDREVAGLAFPAPRQARQDEKVPRYAGAAYAGMRRPSSDLEVELTEILGHLGPDAGGEGGPVRVQPAHQPKVEIWLHGTNPGRTPQLAGKLGLPFGANYHFAGAGLLDSIAEYRASFVPGRILAPHVAVSVDVVVAGTEADAEAFATANRFRALWNKLGTGVAPLPGHRTLAAHTWTDRHRELTADRAAISLAGTADRVTDALHRLQELTDADELVINTTTFEHQHRCDSYRMLAQCWYR